MPITVIPSVNPMSTSAPTSDNSMIILGGVGFGALLLGSSSGGNGGAASITPPVSTCNLATDVTWAPTATVSIANGPSIPAVSVSAICASSVSRITYTLLSGTAGINLDSNTLRATYTPAVAPGGAIPPLPNGASMTVQARIVPVTGAPIFLNQVDLLTP
jgi:hypothetical protein